MTNFTKKDAADMVYAVLIIETLLCRKCKHRDEFGIRNFEVCNKCCHYVESKFEIKDE